MSANAWIGAILGAVVGAIAWAAITYFTGYEVGYVAWGVGGAVGGLAAKFGSQGTAAGVICAALTLVAIFGGKLIATNFLVEKELEGMAAAFFTRATHAELIEDAKLFAALEPDADPRQFMLDRGYSDAASVERVTPEELASFKTDSLALMEPFRNAVPEYERWARESSERMVKEAMAEVPLMEAVTENLGLMDLLFAFLGVATAFGLGQGAGPAAAPPRARGGGLSGPLDGEIDIRPSGTGDAPVPRRRR